jgi:NADPH:quinone reductase-like Zn-dependent oxidoreductase
MRAIEVTRFGGPEVLVPTDLLDPMPGPAQVVVEVAAHAAIEAREVVGKALLLV